MVEELPRELLRLTAAMPFDALQSMVIEDAHACLERFVATVPAHTPRLTIQVSCGKLCLAIIRAVLRHQHDLAVIVGNTAETVLRGVTCSVLAIKPERFVCPLNAQLLLTEIQSDGLTDFWELTNAGASPVSIGE